MTVSKHTIVYAEDDLDDLFIVKQAFEQHDHITIVHAPDGKKALLTLEQMLVENFFPCLVILDINMPIMDGKEMLRKLREEVPFKELPVIMFSTSDSSRDRQFAENYDADFLSKPSTYNELKALVGHFVSKCRFEVEKTA